MKTFLKPPEKSEFADKISQARKQGYSDNEISSFLSQKDPRISQAMEAGYSPDEVLNFMAKPTGFARKTKHHFGKLGTAAETAYENPLLFAKELGVTALQALEHFGEAFNPPMEIPGQERKPKPSEALQKYLTEGLPEKTQQGAQDIADVAELLLTLPALKGGKSPKIKGTKAAPSGGIRSTIAEREALSQAPQVAEKWVEETFPSGLTKPGAVGAKNVRFGVISKARQEKTLENLEKQAQDLFRKKVAEKAPITEKIREGFDFDKYHQEGYGKLREMAKKANPQIDITPLSKFFREEIEKLRGIRAPSPEKMKIKNEISKFYNKPTTFLDDLLKNRLNNTSKMKGVYERRLMKGTQQEYVDFLNRMNKKIDESIFSTLPENSEWSRQFKKLNAEFGEYKNAQSIIKQMEPLLREKMNTSALTRLAENPDKQKLLKIKMGEKAAEEIIQIAKDLKEAQRWIKKIPVKDLNKFDAVFPISWVFKPAGALMTVKKGYDYSRKAYGYLLSNPAKRKVFDEMIHAVVDNNVAAYEKAVQRLEAPEAVKLLEHTPPIVHEKPSEPLKSKSPIKKEPLHETKEPISERRAKTFEEKKKEIQDRLERALDSKENARLALKKNPKNTIAKKIYAESNRLIKSSEKLLDDLETEGKNLISKKMIEEQTRKEKYKRPIEKKGADKVYSKNFPPIKEQIIENTKVSIERLEDQIHYLKKMRKEHPQNKSISGQIKDFSNRLQQEKNRLNKVSLMKEEDFYTKPRTEQQKKTIKKTPVTDFEDIESVKKSLEENEKKLRKLKSKSYEERPADDDHEIKIRQVLKESLEEIIKSLEKGESIY